MQIRTTTVHRTLLMLVIGLLLPFLWPGVLPNLFDTTLFAHDDHSHWPISLTLLHVGSDVLIGVAYTVIASVLGVLVYKNRQLLPFDWVVLSFGLFIVACGFTHLMHAFIRFQPMYWLDAYVRAFTAIVSVATAVALLPLLPRVNRLIQADRQLKQQQEQLQEANLQLQQQQEALQELNRSLDQRARALNQDLLDKTQQLEFTNKELEAFAFSISHDLRTPLRSINGFSQALLEDHQDALDDTGKGYLSRIKKNSERMADLIDDILHLSRISRAEIRHQQVNLTRMAQEVLEDLQSIQPERKVEVTIEEDLLALGDPALLRMVVQNLLGNAWKFTSKTPHAQIHFGKRQEQGNTVFFVSDNGAGFDMQNASRLFGVFQRLHTTEAFEGNGVGLASVQRILHRHGGHITATGQLNAGATFTFALPEE